MAEALLVLALIVVVTLAGAVAAVAALLHWVVVRNRVVAGRRSPAPLAWLISSSPEARLHRRLRASMSAAATAMAVRRHEDLGLSEVVADLEDRAVELDAQLVIASKAARGSRRRMRLELRSEVAEIERLVERVVRMSRAWGGVAPSERGLTAVRERLELLEGALRELDGMDVTAARRTMPTGEVARRRLQA